MKRLGKDEASTRQQLVNKRPVELLRDREFWRTREEEKQRFQAKKEAWEFFRRVPSFKPKSLGEFEEEFKRRVMTGYSSAALKDEKSIWMNGKLSCRRKRWKETVDLEARERVKMGKEDAGSKRRTEWERIMERVPVSPFLRAAP